jgi:hypothetical protein
VRSPTGVVRVGEVQPASAAAGMLAPGDTIFAVAGEPVYAGSGPGVAAIVQRHAGKPVELAIDHAGELRTVTIQPRDDGKGLWRLGIVLDASAARDHSAGTALPRALAFPPRQLVELVGALVPNDEPVVDPGGPTRIVAEYRAASAVTLVSVLLSLGATFASFVAFVVLIVDLIRAIRVLRQPRTDPLAA